MLGGVDKKEEEEEEEGLCLGRTERGLRRRQSDPERKLLRLRSSREQLCGVCSERSAACSRGLAAGAGPPGMRGPGPGTAPSTGNPFPHGAGARRHEGSRAKVRRKRQ